MIVNIDVVILIRWLATFVLAQWWDFEAASCPRKPTLPYGRQCIKFVLLAE